MTASRRLPSGSRPVPVLFSRGSWPEAQRVAQVLRKETVGGALLLAATVLALVWANSPWTDAYASARDFTFGPAALHLDLSVGAWATDGLLAIFFFVAGLELKREFVAGDLRDPRRAALPVAAAVGGMIAPGGVVRAGQPQHRRRGAGGLGDPDGDRHRVRAGRPGGDRQPPAAGAAHVPADPGGRR